jgi:hypothetical protein
MRKDGPEAAPIVKAFSKYEPTKDEYYAKYKNPIDIAGKGISEDRKNVIEDLMNRERRDRVSHRDELTDPKEQDYYDEVRNQLKNVVEDRNTKKMPVWAINDRGQEYARAGRVDPFYHPQQLSPHVIEALQENRNSPESQTYKQEFIDHQIASGRSAENALKTWKGLEQSFDNSTVGSKDHFRGLDLEQGAGLPDSLMRPGATRNLERYFRRVAQARAFHDTIESNPEVASKLGFKKDPWGKDLPESDFHSPRVNDVLNRIKGEAFDPEESKIKAANRIATGAMLGPLTNIHILASNVSKAISLVEPHQLPAMITKMVTGFHDGVEQAYKNGSLTSKRKMFSDLVDAHATGLEKLNSVADGISRLNGRGVTDYVTKGLLQSAGDYIVRTKLPLAQNGDVHAQRFMKHVDPDFSPEKQYSDEEISRVASNFSGLMHGKHDARTMPTWMLHEGAVQPFLSLMSWSIGQTSDFARNVITPTKEGNYKPLLMSTLGAALGGYAIKELREKLANKKSPIPAFNEIANAPADTRHKLPLIGYNLAAMASFAGYAGLLSTGVKSLFDVAYKNAPQGATFPLDEVVANSAGIASKAAAAIANADNLDEYIKIGTHATADLLRENIQAARLISSWGDQEGLLGEQRKYKKNLNTEEEDLRRYKMAANLPYSDQSTGGADNPYYFENRKAFKHTLDLKDAANQVPALVHEALESSNGNMEVFKDKLKALKGSSYPSMPDPERTPMMFYNYLKFLQNTQGTEAAKNRMVEYMRNNEIGKARSSLIPAM